MLIRHCKGVRLILDRPIEDGGFRLDPHQSEPIRKSSPSISIKWPRFAHCRMPQALRLGTEGGDLK
jgi:hypothetical protein